jgi:Protein of unknown function (DUF3179)
VWESTVDGRPLTFRLSGINNQNFIMRDEETGSWWQQVTGEAVLGPLKGQRLRRVAHDELTFGLWKRERPRGRVLRPDEQLAADNRYAPADWESRMTRVPVVTPARDGDALGPRALVVGLSLGGKDKAYPFDALVKQSPVVDEVGGVPVVVVVGEDGKSVRAFDRRVDGRALEFYAKPGSAPLRLVDSQTGSEWDFAGTCLTGALAGRQLTKVVVLNDYWFDWQLYHPETEVYRLG